MRDEYDFSKGVQGKHADRMAEAVVMPSLSDAACKYEVYKDPAGLFHWRLKADTGEVIVASQTTYSTAADCLAAIESFRWITHTAAVASVG